MGQSHLVKQGDTLYTIAHRFGFDDWRTIYDDGANAALKAKRPHPHVLEPGDVVAIPEKAPPLQVTLDGNTKLVLRTMDHQLFSVALHHPNWTPMADLDATVSFDGGQRKLKTDASGVIKTEIPITATHVTITVRDDTWELAVGHLNPLDQTDDQGRAGCVGRLGNLGYLGEQPSDDELADALDHFQLDHDLPRTGTLDAATRDKLTQRHGC